MSDQMYQQAPPQYPPVQQYPPAQNMNIADHFVGEGKFSLFFMLSALLLFIGALFVDLCLSGLITGDIRALLFLGELLVDLGIVAMLTLMLLAGATRDDLPENTRSYMLRAAGFGIGLYVLAWALRIMSSSAMSSFRYY